jgi:prefoldin subunit 1
MSANTKNTELVELQEKFTRVARDFNEVNLKLEINHRNKKRSELTLAELTALPPTTPMYKTVGRMFLRTPISSINAEITGYMKQCEENISNLEKKQAYLGKQAESIQANLQELSSRT